MINKLKSLLMKAIDMAYLNDHDLFNRGRLEQACVFRIGCYMQELMNNKYEYSDLRQYSLDCEYNKNGFKAKSTPRFPHGTRPDLILHERTTNEHNLLIVEFKVSPPQESERDHKKLEDFTSRECGYQYRLGAYVVLGKRYTNITYFENGRQVDSFEIIHHIL